MYCPSQYGMSINTAKNGCTCGDSLINKTGLCYNTTSQQFFDTPSLAPSYFNGVLDSIRAKETLSFVPLPNQVILNNNNNQSAIVTVTQPPPQMPVIVPTLPGTPSQSFPPNLPPQIIPSMPIQNPPTPIQPLPSPLPQMGTSFVQGNCGSNQNTYWTGYTCACRVGFINSDGGICVPISLSLSTTYTMIPS
jgi:hypothetical protein